MEKKNPQYPDTKPEDFASFYSPSQSPIPWQCSNCAFCGRTEQAMNSRELCVIVREISHYDPYRRKHISDVVCSDLCEEGMRERFRAEFEVWKINTKK